MVEQGGTETAGVTITDSNGRYTVSDLLPGSFVALNVSRWLQPCTATATVGGNTVLDVEVVRDRSVPWTRTSPILSGQVYYTTADGIRRPYTESASIGFFRGCRGLTLVRAITDDNGRFEVCRVPLGPACLSVGAWEFTFVNKSINIAGDTVIDIDVGPPPPPSPPPSPPPNIDGTYSLQFNSTCAAVPAHLRSRTYTATISGSPNFTVALSGATFREDPADGLLNSFSGSVQSEPPTAHLNVRWPRASERWGIVEQIGPTTFLEIIGRGTGSIGDGAIDGTIAGGIAYGENLRDDDRHTGCLGVIGFQMRRR